MEGRTRRKGRDSKKAKQEEKKKRMKWKKGTGKEEARVGREGRKETSGLDNVWNGRNGAEWWNTGPFSQP